MTVPPRSSALHLAPQRRALLDELAREILHNYGRGRVFVGIDGADGAGKSVFADELADALERAGRDAVRASLDDFHLPRAQRHARGRESASGCYRDSYDYALFRRVLVDPFRMGGSTGFQLAAFDLAADMPLESRWATAPADAVLVVDGVFLHRPEIRGIWHYTVWLDAPDDVRYERMVARDGSHPEPGSPLWDRYAGAQQLYRAEIDPRAASDAIVDNADFDRPARVFLDYCAAP